MIGKPRVISLLTGAASVAALCVLPGAPPATAAACARTHTSSVAVSAKGVTKKWVVNYDQGTAWQTKKVALRKPVNVGGPVVHFVTCKSRSTRKWGVLSATLVNHFYDLTISETPGGRLNPKPHTGTYGWGVFGVGVHGHRVVVSTNRCVKEARKVTALGVARGVLSVPWKVSNKVAWVLWFAGKLLPAPPPDKFRCGDMSRTSLPFVINSKGRVKLSGSEEDTAVWRWPEVTCTYQSCTNVIQETVTVSAG